MEDVRTGTGLDFHRLIEDEARPLLLGAVEIPGGLALKGHSDADVLLHALADALLGALGLGDIGSYFPDTDPTLKNMDSRVILKRALDEMRTRGYKLSNMDVTLIGERPKVLPFRERIIASLAEICEVGLDRVAVKATTTEKMGALGRKEGLACLANVLVFK